MPSSDLVLITVFMAVLITSMADIVTSGSRLKICSPKGANTYKQQHKND
jgi:hypothetical protein